MENFEELQIEIPISCSLKRRVVKMDSGANRITVEWIGGRSGGKRSIVKRSEIVGGVISAGEKVEVVWGKSKKKYDAIVVASHEQRSPPVTVARQRYTPAPVFTFELGSPAPEPVCEQQPPSPAISEVFRSSTSQERHCDCCQKIESKLDTMMSDLKDYVAGEFARLAVRMNALEKTVGNLPTQANSTFYGGIPDFSTYSFPDIQQNQTQPDQIQPD